MMNQTSWICLFAGVFLTGVSHAGDKSEPDSGSEWISDESLADYRRRASTKEPTFKAFGWVVFEFEGVFYGVLEAKGAPEFIAITVIQMDSEIRLSGRSQMILNKSKKIQVPKEGIVTLRGEEYEITGGRSKVIIKIPGAN